MQTTIQKFIQKEQLFQTEDRLLLAVSGGMDSMVMAHILLQLGYAIGLVHCNFQLRKQESDEDEKLVKDWAQQHQLPFFNRSFSTKAYAQQHQLSTQMAARDLRYAYFAEIRQQESFDYILTAHHLDDRLETFWLNFSRGTGWKGLSSLQSSNGLLRRPLLCVNRIQIAQYQQTEKVPYREDASNASDVYRRNAFRHNVLPALYEWEPQMANRMTANFTRLEQMYQIYAQAVVDQLEQWTTKTTDGWQFDRKQLQTHPSSETMVWELLNPYGFNAEDCRQALESKAGTLLQIDKWKLLVQEEQLILQSAEALTIPNSKQWPEGQEVITLDDNTGLRKHRSQAPSRFSKSQQLAWISPDRLVFPLLLRHWLPGDYFCPLGMKGQGQKLQDFFTNNKIDRFARHNQWLLVNGDGKIIWIVGQRLDERFKVSSNDSEVWKIECIEL